MRIFGGSDRSRITRVPFTANFEAIEHGHDSPPQWETILHLQSFEYSPLFTILTFKPFSWLLFRIANIFLLFGLCCP